MIILLEYTPNKNFDPIQEINNIFSSETIDTDVEILDSLPINNNNSEYNYILIKLN